MDDREARVAAVNMALQLARDGTQRHEDASELLAEARKIYDFLMDKMQAQASVTSVSPFQVTLTPGEVKYLKETAAALDVSERDFISLAAREKLQGRTIMPFSEAVKVATGTNNE